MHIIKLNKGWSTLNARATRSVHTHTQSLLSIWYASNSHNKYYLQRSTNDLNVVHFLARRKSFICVDIENTLFFRKKEFEEFDMIFNYNINYDFVYSFYIRTYFDCRQSKIIWSSQWYLYTELDLYIKSLGPACLKSYLEIISDFFEVWVGIYSLFFPANNSIRWCFLLNLINFCLL